ncbi:MAG: peptidase dimerization domain-containing protein [Streptosporangiaceae bacterium]
MSAVDAAGPTTAIHADTIALARIPAPNGQEEARIAWLEQRLSAHPGQLSRDEEGLGGLRGARHACASVAARQVIALEGHGLDAVFTDAIGCLRVELTVTGPGGHSWWDRGRPSAAHELVRLLGGLLDASPAGLALNAGLIRAGSAVNAIAAQAQAMVEGRALDEEPLDELFRLIDDAAGQSPLTVTAQVLDRRPAGRIGRDHPLVAAVVAERRALGAAQLDGVLARLLAGDREPRTATTAGELP